MMKVLKFLLCGLLMALPVFAEEADDRQTATSLRYVSHELDTRQNKLSAGSNKALTYTNAAGNVEQRTVKSDLTGGTTDTSLPMAEAVNAGLGTKQDDIATIDDHTAVTYTGTTGTIGQKGIYQDTGTYDDQTDNLIDAKTFNAALKNGLDNEFVCADRPDAHDPNTNLCWLWEIHNGSARILPLEYTQLEYIESTGTQYIDTGIRQRAKWVHDIAFTERNNKNLMGYAAGMGHYWGQNRSGNDGYELGNQKLSMDSSVRRIIEYDPRTNNVTLTADNQTITAEITSFNNSRYQIFKINGSDMYYVSAKLYGLKVYDTNDVLIHNYVPAQHENDIGLYDTVSHEFFENDGEGVFRAGPVINTNVYLPQNQQ